jgi:hypothetical protein
MIGVACMRVCVCVCVCFLPVTQQVAAEWFNLLAPELFFLILAYPVYKMCLKQEPNTLELRNKLHFEEEKNEEYISCLKYSVLIFVE